MSLSEVLTTAKNIRSGELKEEAQVRQAVITPILKELGWDPMKDMFICGGLNLQELSAEYPVGSAKVDYALLSKGKPQVLIDVRPVGAPTLKVGEQLYQYANSKNIPLLVLTDGTVWDFYLCTTEDPTDRRFCRINIEDTPRQKQERDFKKFLSKKQVNSADAIKAAEKHLNDDGLRRKANQALSEAWVSILDDTDSLLIDSLADKVIESCDSEPKKEAVVTFLKDIKLKTDTPTSLLLLLAAGKKIETGRTPPPSSTPAVADKPGPKDMTTPEKSPASHTKSVLVGYRLDGVEKASKTWKQLMVAILNDLQKRDPGFFQRLYDDPRSQKRNSRWISPWREEIFHSGKQDYPDSSYCELDNHWWAHGHGSKELYLKKLQVFCDIAGIKFGTDLEILEKNN